MGRIRTIKPEFFEHEDLQDLEAANPGQYCMLVFAGLWCQCDKNGVFLWKPRTLKLKILPFLKFDMEQTLTTLADSSHIFRYEVDGAVYGYIKSFKEHQRVSGKEEQTPAKYPLPDREETEKQQGSTGEVPEKHPGAQEGKGRERKGKDKAPRVLPHSFPLPEWLPREKWSEFVEHRKRIKSPLNEKACKMALAELEKLRIAGNEPCAVVDQTICSGKWLSFYPLRKAEIKPFRPDDDPLRGVK